MIRAFERTRDLLTVPGRRPVVLRSAEPLLVLADSGVALRRKDGTFCLTPPLLPKMVEVFAPLSPTCLLISTPRAHYRSHQGLTRKIAGKANAGVAALQLPLAPCAMCRFGVSGWVSVTAHQGWVFSMVGC